MNFPLISSILLLLLTGAASASRFYQRYEQQEPVDYVYPAPEPYRFSYTTGSQQGVSDVAQHFREENRDLSGVVTGKYGYVDPYGRLRVVNYRAGPEGYTVTGDTGADEEGLRAQRQLYSTDRSYLVQQQVWQALAAGRPIDSILASAAVAGSSASSSSAASASSSSSSSSNSADWTAVSGGGEQLSADYYTKGGGNRFTERYTAIKSPSSALRETSTSSVNSQRSSTSASSSASSSSSVSGYSTAPVATKTVETTSSRYVQPSHYSSTVYHTTKSAPLVQQQSYWYSSPYTSYQVIQPAARLVTTKTVHQQPARLIQTTKTVQQPAIVQSARLVETTKTVQQPAYQTTTHVIQSPAAKLVEIKHGSSSSSSASASASASASSSASSGAYLSGVKGYSGAIKAAPIRTGRYVVVPTGGRTVVNFSQGGPQPYKYSYAFK